MFLCYTDPKSISGKEQIPMISDTGQKPARPSSPRTLRADRQRQRRIIPRTLRLIRSLALAGVIIACIDKAMPFFNEIILLAGQLSQESPRELTVTAFAGQADSGGQLCEFSDQRPAARGSSTAPSDAAVIEALPSASYRADTEKTSGVPQLLSEAQVEDILSELALQDDDIREIYNRREEYPKELLAALASNREMTEYVKEYLLADTAATGGISDEEKALAFPLFLQWDRRWGYVPYGSGPIGITGCGPTCLSMVIFSLTGDMSATPDALAALSMEKGYYTEGAGTAWLFMKDAAAFYGLTAVELGLDEEVMRQYLDLGRPIICAMRPGDFTATGHFIVIYGYDENGFRVNDPNSLERSGRSWSFSTLKGQIRNLWGYFRS